jgi:hypothetical protein
MQGDSPQCAAYTGHHTLGTGTRPLSAEPRSAHAAHAARSALALRNARRLHGIERGLDCLCAGHGAGQSGLLKTLAQSAKITRTGHQAGREEDGKGESKGQGRRESRDHSNEPARCRHHAPFRLSDASTRFPHAASMAGHSHHASCIMHHTRSYSSYEMSAACRRRRRRTGVTRRSAWSLRVLFRRRDDARTDDRREQAKEFAK